DVVVENGSAGIYLIYDEDATVKSISKLYKDVLCLKTVLNFRVTFETDLYHLCIGIEDIDEVEWAEYVRKHYVD
ncbi:MAG: hypothetical protein J6V11_03835, partial [Alphaproteobacteria bacterium]|nr:hypothetical protein [Alphaproteobacteria bacterium]